MPTYQYTIYDGHKWVGTTYTTSEVAAYVQQCKNPLVHRRHIIDGRIENVTKRYTQPAG